MDQDGIAAVQEAIRRRAGLGDSGAGIRGGAQAANSNRPSNPIANGGMTPMTQAPQGAMPPAPTQGNPLAGAQSMVNGASSPDAATMIIKSFSDFLKKLSPGQQMPTI